VRRGQWTVAGRITTDQVIILENIVVHEVQRHGVLQVLDLLREGVRQAGESAHGHAHGERRIEATRVTSARSILRFCSVTGVEWESESRASVGLSSTDAEGWHARNRERNQCGRIMDTHSPRSRANNKRLQLTAATLWLPCIAARPRPPVGG
jgi:hypothetical protein